MSALLKLLALPLNFLIALLYILFYVLGFLPLSWQWRLAGLIAYSFRFSQRSRIIILNLEACFPEKSVQERKTLQKLNLQHTAFMLFETMASFHSNKRLKKRIKRIDGVEYIKQLKLNEQGSLLMGAHYTSMNAISWLTRGLFDASIVYRPSGHAVSDWVISMARRRDHQLFTKWDVRKMAKYLKTGGNLWYTSDQEYGGKGYKLAQFFNMYVNSNVFASRLLKLGNAQPLLIAAHFEPKTKNSSAGYVLTLKEIDINFLTGDEVSNTEYYLKSVEKLVRKYPAQYFWVHRRFIPAINYDTPSASL